MACEMLEDRGFKNLTHVEGSIRDWAKAGLPVTVGQGVRYSLPQQTYMVVGTILVVTGLCTLLISDWVVLFPTVMGVMMFINGYRGTCWMESWLSRMPWNQ